MKLLIEDNKEGKIKVEFEPTISNDLEPGSREAGVPTADPYKVIYLCLRAATTICLKFMRVKQQVREQMAGGKETKEGIILPPGVNVAGNSGDASAQKGDSEVDKDSPKAEEGHDNKV